MNASNGFRSPARVPPSLLRSIMIATALAITWLPARAAEVSFDAPYTSFVTADSPYGLAIGDLNADGNLDLVIVVTGVTDGVLKGPARLSVMLGQGDGSFLQYGEFPTSPITRAVALADLDGDGRLDAVTASRIRRNLSVLMGLGNGAFGAPTDYVTGRAPNSDLRTLARSRREERSRSPRSHGGWSWGLSCRDNRDRG